MYRRFPSLLPSPARLYTLVCVLSFLLGLVVIIGAVTGCGAVPVLPAGEEALVWAAENTSPQIEASPQAAPADCLDPGEPLDPVHAAVVDAVNAYRAGHGLSALRYSRTLEAAAEVYAEDLWRRGFFSHIDPEGRNPGARALAAGFCHRYVGENLAAGQRTVDAAMAAWKASPGHNANLLEPRYAYIGVGVFVDPAGRPYWVQMFAYHLP